MESKHQPDPIELKLPPEPKSVSRARWAMRQFADRVGADADAVALAVSEAVSNAVLHAYRGAKGMIAVCAELAADGRLLVTVVDRGVGMKPDPHHGGMGTGAAADRLGHRLTRGQLARRGGRGASDGLSAKPLSSVTNGRLSSRPQS